MKKKREWLINLRKNRKLTLEKLASLSNISYGSLSKIERGIVKEISQSTIEKLSSFFEKDKKKILDFEKEYRESLFKNEEKILLNLNVISNKTQKNFLIGKNKYKRIDKINKQDGKISFKAYFEGKEY